MSTTTVPDPLRSAPGGRYADDRVVVIAEQRDPAVEGQPWVRAGVGSDGRIVVHHRWRRHLNRLDDDLAEELVTVLTPLCDDHDVFVRAFIGVVVTSHADPMTAWERFYRGSLARIRDPRHEGYADVHRHALDLLPRTSVLDLGASFGFLALHLAQLGVRVIALEREPGTARLLRLMSQTLDVALDVVAEEPAALPDDVADAVALLHVLEHLSPAGAVVLLDEAIRLARHRVVVAVPYESHPIGLYGHVRSLTPDYLVALGAATGLTYDVHSHHGGWLVLDLPASGGLRTRSPSGDRIVQGRAA